jgi:hypothetical protein
MQRLSKWLSENSLVIWSIFFLIFIPLYPKFPLFDLKNTWVYIRLEDMLLALAAGSLFIHIIRRRQDVLVPFMNGKKTIGKAFRA